MINFFLKAKLNWGWHAIYLKVDFSLKSHLGPKQPFIQP